VNALLFKLLIYVCVSVLLGPRYVFHVRDICHIKIFIWNLLM